MTTSITIGARRIGPGEPVYLGAEMAANHDQRLDEAMRILGAAKRAGADAVKLGTAIPRDWLPELRELAGELELDLCSSPGDDLEHLEAIDLAAWEISASEAADPALIRRVAATAKPIILSTGSATLAAIEEALYAVRDAGCDQLALLWRNDACPAPAKELNLRTIPHLGAAFELPVGFGDQTLGNAAAVAAVALGAAIVEKHLTLSRALPIAESAISLEPEEFARMVTSVHTAEDALGDPVDAATSPPD
ncbi:MAG: N-acetylneuraminate synthase family protein [Thermoanaerobaculia bacterium]